MHPIDIYNDFESNVIYSMHFGDGIHSLLRKQSLFIYHLGVDQHVSGCIWRNLTCILQRCRKIEKLTIFILVNLVTKYQILIGTVLKRVWLIVNSEMQDITAPRDNQQSTYNQCGS